MRRCYKILLLIFMVMVPYFIQAQTTSFRSFRETKGAVTSDSRDMYVWGPWVQSSSIFVLDLPKKVILVEDRNLKKKYKYEVFDKPQKWIVKKNYKYINFECMESRSLEKYYIRLCEYDTGEFKITIMTPKKAVRYQVVLLKDEEPDVKFEDFED